MAKGGIDPERQLELEYKAALKNEELRSIRLRRQQSIVMTVVALYAVAAVIAVFIVQDGKTIFFFNDNNRTTQNDDNTSKISQLNSEVKNLKQLIAESGDTSQTALNTRINQLEDKQEALEASVMVDMDKALTAKLLREKQKMIEENLAKLNQSNERLSEKIDNFISNLLTIPIIGFILTVFGLAASYVYSKFREKGSKATGQTYQ